MVGLSVATFLLAIGLAASVVHQDALDSGKIAHSKDDAYYDFRYSVDDEKSGVVSDRWESRSGRFVKGAYSLLDPDGKVRSVHYEVDGDHGFKAVVKTAPSRLNLLSIQSARLARLEHADPPVNKGLDLNQPSLPSLLPSSDRPFNYHAKPPPAPSTLLIASPLTSFLSQRSPLATPVPSSSATTSNLAASALSSAYKQPLFTNDFTRQPQIDQDGLQTLQDLTPPPIDTFSRSYDSYPRPVRTNPNRRYEEPVHDNHRTVYSEYVSKELRRISPRRTLAYPGRGLAVPAKRNEKYLRRQDPIVLAADEPASFSRQWNRPRQYLAETLPLSSSSSYFL